MEWKKKYGNWDVGGYQSTHGGYIHIYQTENDLKEIERRKKKFMYDSLASTIGRYYEDRDLLAFIDSLPEEKQSEDLDEAVSEHICIAADKHIKRVVDAAGHPGWDWSTQDIADAFKAGAQWMKDQLTVK